MSDNTISRRRIIQAMGAGLLLPGVAPAFAVGPNGRPKITDGIQAGDVTGDRALIWSRTDRPSKMIVEWDTKESFNDIRRVVGPTATTATDFTCRVDLRGLPQGQSIFYRVSFETLDDHRLSFPVLGQLRTAPAQRRNIRFVWSGDTVGQGFGINPDIGGMRIYDAMRQRQPDFFLHSGDTIYADGPIQAELTTVEGKVWRNITTEAKSKVAETLDEYRGNYRYNLLDDNVRRFNAEVPQIWQWDDHETTNNWSDSKVLDDRYRVKDIHVLAARARQAYLEYAPMRMAGGDDAGRIYRRVSYGPLLDIFVLDMRSYRGPNSANLQTQAGHESAFLGASQLAWLKRELEGSKATWKIIAADMPIGLQVPDGKGEDGRKRWEAIANGDDGEPKGRELEIADLLGHIRRKQIRNTVWLTADVHYCAAHHYSPERAAYKGFEPFWEFVAGPLNAGAFGPNALDGTFGPHVSFQKAPPKENSSPLSGFQFFGEVEIDAESEALTVSLRDLNGAAVHTQVLEKASAVS
ncbi:alkaline phosphatase D family protein [Pseudomonas matsuisoli]|uniref:Extracelullar DNA degradation protein EddA n=1 Tax=Pseudomonas matsuisoli TaxID=1515666 RepID=A0A917PY52_9PSED|nr:alkaline phosphatase D family protein [Pseudomonas matsuisoli]GGJ98430.1 extracelullar DNA degradation protein EddA [Pseudomonas matsuisoli]